MTIDFSVGRAAADLGAVRAFIGLDVIPLESEDLRSEHAGRPRIDPEQVRDPQRLAQSGLLGCVDTGGMGLDAVMDAMLSAENACTFVPFSFGGSADVVRFLGI